MEQSRRTQRHTPTQCKSICKIIQLLGLCLALYVARLHIPHRNVRVCVLNCFKSLKCHNQFLRITLNKATPRLGAVPGGRCDAAMLVACLPRVVEIYADCCQSKRQALQRFRAANCERCGVGGVRACRQRRLYH